MVVIGINKQQAVKKQHFVKETLYKESLFVCIQTSRMSVRLLESRRKCPTFNQRRDCIGLVKLVERANPPLPSVNFKFVI